MKFVGIGLMVLSAFLFYFGWGWIAYILMSVGLPCGFLLFLFSTFGRSSESDIDEYIKRHTENLEIDFESDKHLEKRLSTRLSSEIAEGYEYSEGVMLKKAKNGTIRSSLYTKAIIYPLDTAMLISYRTVSMISDEKKEEKLEIAYADVTSFRFEEDVRQQSFRKTSFRVKPQTLIIEYSAGKTLRLPMHSSIETDHFVDRMNELITESKN